MSRGLDISKLPKAETISEGDADALARLLKQHKINADEYKRVKAAVGRAPTMSELGIFSAMWSEHCSYKSSRIHLKRLPTKGKDVVVGPGENAGVVRLKDKLCVAFKMESHNHPSYIEPYQGAATGVGGILRDVFCMGARPIANLNCLRFGKRTHPRTNYIYSHAVRGIGDYGNCVGVPTVGGNISFDATYDGNCLVNAMNVGLIHEDKIFKGFASGPGNLVVYVGSATGRDGIHGATMASDSFTTADSQERSTIQVGDPFTEKLLIEATLEVLEAGLVVGLQDMGAAGLTSSSFEMAGRAGNGLFIDLDKIPVRAQNMTAYELLLSESQERMLMVVEPSKWEDLAKILRKWELAHAVIGEVTSTGRMQMTFGGVVHVDLPVAPLTDDAPLYERPRKPRPINDDRSSIKSEARAWLEHQGEAAALKQLLEDTGPKTTVFTQYDQHIGNRTVLGSLEEGAAVMWLRSPWHHGADNLGLAIATACNERYCAADAKVGAAHAVLKCARMLAATGGAPIAITDCMNYGNPEDPQVMEDFATGIDGIAEACQQLGVAVVSGNVSLYNETDGQSIYPTPMIGMVGRVEDVRKAVPAVLRTKAQLYVLIPKRRQFSFVGSLVAKQLGSIQRSQALPPINWDAEVEAADFLRGVIADDLIVAARDVADGGIATTIARMCRVNSESYKFYVDKLVSAEFDAINVAFGEGSGAYVVACDKNIDHLILAARQLKHVDLIAVGSTN